MIRPTSADAIFHGGKNLVERHDDVIEFLRRFAEPELQRQKRAGHGSRHGDFFLRDFLAGKFLFCHEHRAVAVAHARAAGQQRVFVGDVGVGVDADGGNVEFAARGALVQRLDVLQDVLKMKTVRRNQILRERVKHEGVIRVGRMAERQSRFFHPRKLNHAARSCHDEKIQVSAKTAWVLKT